MSTQSNPVPLFVPTLLIIALVYFFISSKHPATAIILTKEQNAGVIVSNINYIKDPRTGICYAFYCNRASIAMAVVLEEKIPADLLVIAEVNDLKD